jgi:hypothetical protein
LPSSKLGKEGVNKEATAIAARIKNGADDFSLSLFMILKFMDDA